MGISLRTISHLRRLSIVNPSWITHLPLLWVSFIFCIWNVLSLGSVSLMGIVTIVSIIYGSTIIGELFWQLIPKQNSQLDSLVFKLLIGLLLSNCLLFFISLVLPFGLAWDWILLLSAAVVVAMRTKCLNSNIFRVSNRPEAIVLYALPCLVSIWTHQLLQTPQVVGDEVQFWGSSDVLTHMAQLGVQARGHGIYNMSDFIMANAPLHPYHFASYLFPALITQVEHYASLAAYSSFLLPAGIVILGLSAYVFGSVLFSPAAGCIASLGLLLVPDPFQQGFGNLFLGQSFWLMQSIPAMPYGVAACALVFIFLFEAFRTQAWRWVLLAYGFVLITLLYKAHLFVAISWPALILPALLMGKASWIMRTLLILILSLLFFACMALSQMLPGMPTLRLDGSGFTEYTHWLTEIQNPGLIKSAITLPFIHEHGRTYLKVLTYSLFILACSLGIALFINFLISLYLACKKPRYIVLFPYLVGAIYLVMALGFAMETKGIGEAEELQHRPFIWAYFVFTVWALAGCYWALENALEKSSRLPKIVMIFGLSLLVVPWQFSADIQNLEKGGGLIHIPRCQYDAAQYLRHSSGPQDLIQSSNASLALSALAGRQNWVAVFYRRLPKNYESQMQSFHQLLKLDDKSAIDNFIQDHGIRYFVSEPGATLKWNSFFQNQIVFECQGYRIFEFN